MILILYLKKIKNSPKGWKKWLSGKSNIYLLNKINNYICEINKELVNTLSLSEKIYWIKHNYTDFPKCPTCGSPITSYKSFNKGYHLHCSCKCSMNDKTTHERLIETCIKKYGTKNAAQSKIVQNKMKQTCLERFGATNIFATNIGKEHIKQTMIKRYGVINPQQNEIIKQKTQQTLIKRYGVNCACKLNPVQNISKGELELYEYIKSVSILNIIRNDREVISPFELDIYIPQLQIGIEYNGDYWHGLPNMKQRDNYKNKLCEEHNIKLIRIKESEWNKNKAIVKDKLKNILNC